jgi:hypothetical protein
MVSAATRGSMGPFGKRINPINLEKVVEPECALRGYDIFAE